MSFFLRPLFLLLLSSSALMWGACVSNVTHDLDVTSPATNSYIRVVYCLPTSNGSATLPGIYVRQVQVRELNSTRSATIVQDISKNNGYAVKWSDESPLLSGPEYFVDYGDQPCISAYGTAIAYRQVYASGGASSAAPVDYAPGSTAKTYIVWRPLSGTIGWLSGAGTAQCLWYNYNGVNGVEKSEGSFPTPPNNPIFSRNPALNQDGTILAYSGYDDALKRYCIYKATGSITTLASHNQTLSMSAPSPSHMNLSSKDRLKVYAWQWNSTTIGWDGNGDLATIIGNFWDYRSPTTDDNIGDADSPSVYSVTVTGVITHYVAFSCEIKNTERWCKTPTDPTTVMYMEQDPPFTMTATRYINTPSTGTVTLAAVNTATKADSFYCFNLAAKDPSIFVHSTAENPEKSYEVSLTSSVVELQGNRKTFHRLHANTGRATQPCLAYDVARDELNVSYASTARLLRLTLNLAETTADKSISIDRGHPVYSINSDISVCFGQGGGGSDIFLRRLPRGQSGLDPRKIVTTSGRFTVSSGQDGSEGQDIGTGSPRTANPGRLITRLTRDRASEFSAAEIGMDTGTYGPNSSTAAALLCQGPLPNDAKTFTAMATGAAVASITAVGVFTTAAASQAVAGYYLRVTGASKPQNNRDWLITGVTLPTTISVDVSSNTPVAEAGGIIKCDVLQSLGYDKDFLRKGLYAAPVIVGRTGTVYECSAKVVETANTNTEWSFLGKLEFKKGDYVWGNYFVSLTKNDTNMYLALRMPPLSETLDFQKNAYFVELEKNPDYLTKYGGAPNERLNSAILALTSRDLDDGKADELSASRKIPIGTILYIWPHGIGTVVLSEPPPATLDGHLDGVWNAVVEGVRFDGEPSPNPAPVYQLMYLNGYTRDEDGFKAPFAVWFWKKNQTIESDIGSSLAGSRPLSLASDGRFGLVLSAGNAYGNQIASGGGVTVSLLLFNPIIEPLP